MQLPGAASTFYYEYYDSEGELKCIDPQLLLKYNTLIKSPAEITYIICCGIQGLDDDQKVRGKLCTLVSFKFSFFF